ncbi:MAG: restriction endonuclease subunit S [Oscillospiraceae bacterium]|nr:restriction endonuclease subunit S [Oscillospiraceae bacterium]
MFPESEDEFPELRFKEYTLPWEHRRFGDIFEEYSEKGHAELPALTIVQGSGTIRRDKSERKLHYDKASLSNYKIVRAGDFVVHLRSFEGGLEKATINGIVSPAYHVFHGKEIDPRFFYSYFRSSKFIKKDLKPHVYGIRDGRSIDVDGMKTIEIPWTSLKEQQTIGEFLELLGKLITIHQHKAALQLDTEKALMQLLLTGQIRVCA